MTIHRDDVLETPHAIVSAGVDWLTCTLKRERDDKHLWSVGERLLNEDEDRGNEVLLWKREGYEGWATSGVRIGKRQDTYCLSLSSDMARDHWREAYAESTNVSRLDLQTTVELIPSQPRIVRELHQQALSHRTKNGRPPERTLIQNTTRGDTLNIGRRASDVYMRAYDKGREQRTHEAGRLLRYEVELKRERARHYARALSLDDRDDPLSISVVSGRFLAQGVRVPSSIEEGQWNCLFLATTSTERKLAWVRRCVAPTVQFLLARVDRDTLIQALGMSPDAKTPSQVEKE